MATDKKSKGPGIGLVLVTHGVLAEALLDAMVHVVGPQENIAPICIGPDDEMGVRRAEIMEAIVRVEAGAGVIVMTDMFGGTPSNLALSALGEKGVEVVAGVNLPMLIKFASTRSVESLETAVVSIQEAGRKYINVASSFLRDSE
ncbi:MAG: PTS sugar transporter subunit IIA [Rhodospirillales bacterium]|nr:PTS sugar transporter subunit IIA [Rhodospirillales bacterium]MBT4005860.1 PTS sugar transporter subunit IIA [Rhodospirillales bacterium]MBT5076423.1 PTS sugar transporter subunit IIA [Rhodospirillales bacterium]MBT5114145.1 PTS sugar transporter subunit IIA [Rhodospirillales bacterium]MBT5672673.1 PTS sugar transporter subunit IIA [Rhodospirillales bacterium]